MKRFFNTAGPCFVDRHYMIASETRFTEINHLIDEQRYFNIHAPRQTGKTTLIQDLVNKLNKQGNGRAQQQDDSNRWLLIRTILKIPLQNAEQSLHIFLIIIQMRRDTQGVSPDGNEDVLRAEVGHEALWWGVWKA